MSGYATNVVKKITGETKGKVQLQDSHVVFIQDKRFNIIFYLVFSVFVMGFLVKSFLGRAYLEFDNIDGVVQAFLDNNGYPPLDIADLQFCQPPNQCAVWDLEEMVDFPPATERTLSITTAVREQIRKRKCKKKDKRCGGRATTEKSTKKFFIADVDRQLLKIDHSMHALRFSREDPHNPGFSGTSRNLIGRLVDESGATLKEFNNSAKLSDHIPVTLLLQAAGTSLDATSDTLVPKYFNRSTFRERGMVLFVQIHYENEAAGLLQQLKSLLGHQGKLHYTIRVKRQVYIEASTTQVMSDSNEEVSLRKRYMIRLVFQQTGRIGKLSLIQIIMQLVSAFGLARIVKQLVDMLATRYYKADLEEVVAREEENKAFIEEQQEQEMKRSSTVSAHVGAPATRDKEPVSLEEQLDLIHSIMKQEGGASPPPRAAPRQSPAPGAALGSDEAASESSVDLQGASLPPAAPPAVTSEAPRPSSQPAAHPSKIDSTLDASNDNLNKKDN